MDQQRISTPYCAGSNPVRGAITIIVKMRLTLMIIFNDSTSNWEDEDNTAFKVSMPPDGTSDDALLTFRDPNEFWEWYYANE